MFKFTILNDTFENFLKCICNTKIIGMRNAVTFSAKNQTQIYKKKKKNNDTDFFIL